MFLCLFLPCPFCPFRPDDVVKSEQREAKLREENSQLKKVIIEEGFPYDDIYVKGQKNGN